MGKFQIPVAAWVSFYSLLLLALLLFISPLICLQIRSFSSLHFHVFLLHKPNLFFIKIYSSILPQQTALGIYLFFLPWTPESICQYISSPLTPLVKVFLYHLCFFMFPRYQNISITWHPIVVFTHIDIDIVFFTSIKYSIRHINYITSTTKINKEKNNNSKECSSTG